MKANNNQEKSDASKESTSKTSKWPLKRIIATILTLVFSFIIVMLCSSIVSAWMGASEEKAEQMKLENAKKEAESVEVIGDEVRVLLVSNESVKSGFSAQGRLRAYDKTDVVAEVQGMMKPTDKRFKIGTRYTKDEVMIEMDDTEARLGLKSQKAQLHTAITAMMPDLKIDMPESYNQWKSYLDAFDVNRPIKDFPKSKSDREAYYVSTKNLHTQYYNIKSAEVRLGKYQVRAPFSGVLVAANVNEGGLVRAGTPLGTLMNSGTYEMEAAVQVADLKYIKNGSSVKVVSDDSGKSWNGKVKRIGDIVDATTQTATVYIGLSGKGLREGQYLRAIINTSAISKAMEVPRNWLVNNDKLYVVKDDQLELKTIEVVKVAGDNVIVKGLDDGDRLLADKVSGAFEGMKVKVAE